MATTRGEAIDSATGSDHRDDVVVLFADLAGYTALTEAHGDDEAARAAIRLLELTKDAYDGEALVIKSIGDGVMVAFAEIATAVSAAMALSHAAYAEPRFPALRVGVHAGPAVLRAGDVFGATVNVASRVADEAQPGQVLMTQPARDLLGAVDDLELENLGPTELRHVRNPVVLVQVRESGHTHDLTVDPVCRMAIPADASAVKRTGKGGSVWFCSESCATLFAENPAAYRRPEA